jgi:cell division protein FtsI/penicillin-binding protein 2
MMKDILVSVTEGKDGTGANARVEGMKVAGKTGTAQKYDPVLGYSGDKYYSSFIGFLPADNPELLIGFPIIDAKAEE